MARVYVCERCHFEFERSSPEVEQCPDCGKKIEVFGESHVDAIARQYGIPHTAALPIDRKLAASADKGMIELTNGDWLDEIANAIDQLQPRERK